MTSYTQHLFALILVMFGASCADDMPVTAHYAPADCPPAATKALPDAAVEEDPVEDPPPTAEAKAEAEAEPAPEPHAKSEPRTASDRVNLNTANALQLATLPGVGPALAARIIAYREKRAFEKAEDLRRVRGIGPAKFAKLQGSITVGKAGGTSRR